MSVCFPCSPRRASPAGAGMHTLTAAINYAASLLLFSRFEEAKSLLRRFMPVARRVLGNHHPDTLRIRINYANALYEDPAATLDDIREAVTMLEETDRTARRVLGGAHPLVSTIERNLVSSRAALREASSPRNAS